MSFPTSPINGQLATVNGTTYIYNATTNAWKRQTSGQVYDLDEIYPDGVVNTFALKYNQTSITSLTNPWGLTVTVNGILQPAFTADSDKVWLSHTLCAQTGYTLESGNIKFADPPPAGSKVLIRTVVGIPVSTVKTYPFKPVDIMLGT